MTEDNGILMQEVKKKKKKKKRTGFTETW